MVLRPVGSHSPAIYWRRRIVLLLALVIVIVLIARACSGGGSAHRTNTNGPGPTLTSSSPPPSAISACMPNEEAIIIGSPGNSTAGAPLKFSATVSVTGDEPCRLVASPAHETWTITSGKSTVWSNAGCQPPDAGVAHVLRPGKHFRLHLHWNGKASTSGCGSGSAAAVGSYAVQLTLGSVTSNLERFSLAAA